MAHAFALRTRRTASTSDTLRPPRDRFFEGSEGACAPGASRKVEVCPALTIVGRYSDPETSSRSLDRGKNLGVSGRSVFPSAVLSRSKGQGFGWVPSRS